MRLETAISIRCATTVMVLCLTMMHGSAHAQGAVNPVRLLQDLASTNQLKAHQAATKVLASPHTFGRRYLMRAMHTARRLSRREHMGLIASVLMDADRPHAPVVRSTAALTLGEMGRIRKAHLLPRTNSVSDALDGGDGSDVIDEEPGGCGGRPVPAPSTGPVAGPGRPGWLTQPAQQALIGCVSVSGNPRIVRQACVRALGVGSVVQGAAVLRLIVSSKPDGEDPITVLLAARSLSRLTHRDHVSKTIRERAANHLRRLSTNQQSGSK